MIARRTPVGLPAAVLGAALLLGIAGCGDDEPTIPTALPAPVTTVPPAASPTVAPVPAVGAPIIPSEPSTSATTTPRTTTRTTTRPRTTTPTRRTITVPNNAFGEALFRCLASGRTYDECVN